MLWKKQPTRKVEVKEISEIISWPKWPSERIARLNVPRNDQKVLYIPIAGVKEEPLEIMTGV